MSDFQNLLASMNKAKTSTTEKTDGQEPATNTKETTGVVTQETSAPNRTPEVSARPPSESESGDSPTGTADASNETTIADFITSMQQLEDQIPNGEFLADMTRNVIARIQQVPHIQDFVYKNTKHLETIVSAMHGASVNRQTKTFTRRKKAAKKEAAIEMTLDVLKDIEF